MKEEDFWMMISLSSLICFLVGLGMGMLANKSNIEIQEIQKAENSYYVTVNNEIFFKSEE